ncbi:hypothetical protein Esti_002286 [Eimeria stiedai]
MAHSAFATALYEQVPEGRAARATAGVSPAAAAAAAAAAGGGGLRGAAEVLQQQRQQLLLQRAALLQQCSFFELLAQQKLLDGLHAALRHCVVTLEAFYSDAPAARTDTWPPDHHQQQEESRGGSPATHNPNQQQQQQQQHQRGGGPRAGGGAPHFRSLRGSFISAWAWRRLRRLAAAAKAAGAGALQPGVLRVLLRADAAAALRWVDRHFELLYLLLLAAVETHSFASTSAAFSEGFYGVQRVDTRLFSLHRKLNYPQLCSSSRGSGDGEEEQRCPSSSCRSSGDTSLLLPQLPVALLQQQQQVSSEAAALAAASPLSLSRSKVFCCVVAQVLLPHLRRQLQHAYVQHQEQASAAAAGTAAADASVAAARVAEAAARARLHQHADAQEPRSPLPLDLLFPPSSNSSSNSLDALMVTESVSAWSERFHWWLRYWWLRVWVLLLRVRVKQQQLRRLLQRRVWAALVSVHPRLSLAHDLICFVYALLYLADPVAFPYWSPVLHLLGLVYVRAPPPAAAAGSSSSNNRSWWFAAAETGAQRLRGCLVAVLLVLRALEWWFEYEGALLAPPVKKEEVEPPPPPPNATETSLARSLPQDPRICPLCGFPRENPACIPSGYVFCYRCILTFVRQHRRCPITALHTKEQHVRQRNSSRDKQRPTHTKPQFEMQDKSTAAAAAAAARLLLRC